jgi:hypothetical protein
MHRSFVPAFALLILGASVASAVDLNGEVDRLLAGKLVPGTW